MKKFLFALCIVVVFALFSCEKQPLEIDKIYYNDFEYIKINEDIETDYFLGNQTPNIESFFSFYYAEDIETYEIKSDIGVGKEVFDSTGTFFVTCTITLKNGHIFDTTVELIVNPLPTIYDYIIIDTSLPRNFMIGDDVPDFNSYVTLLNEDQIQSFEIISPIESTQFDTYGHFDICIEITTIEGYLFAKNYQFYVDDGFNFVNGWIERLQGQLNALGDGIISYDSYNEITYFNGTVEHNYIFNGIYRARLENRYGLLYMQSEYIFDEFNEFNEIYVNVNLDQITFYENSYYTDFEWETTEFTWQEYFDSVYIYGDVEVVDLLTGIERPGSVTELDDSYIIGIPVSEENFSFNIALEIIDAMVIFGLYDGTNDEIFTEMMENIDLIKLTVELTKDNFYLRSIELDYTKLLSHLISNNSDIINLSTGYKYFSKAIYRENNFHNNHTLKINDEVFFGEITSTSYHSTIYNYVTSVNARDESTHMIYQSEFNGFELEALNYDTFEYRKVVFDMPIRKIVIFDNLVFITQRPDVDNNNYLSDGYGKITVVNKDTLEVIYEIDSDYVIHDYFFDGDHTVYIYSSSRFEQAFVSYDLYTGEKIDEYRIAVGSSAPIYIQEENIIIFEEVINSGTSMICYVNLNNGVISEKVDIIQVLNLFSIEYAGNHYFILNYRDKETEVLEIHDANATTYLQTSYTYISNWIIDTELNLTMDKENNSIVARDYENNVVWVIDNPLNIGNFIFEDGYVKWGRFYDNYYDTDLNSTSTVTIYLQINSLHNTHFPPIDIDGYEYTLVEGTVDLTTPGTYTQTFTYHLPHEDETFIVVCTYVVYEKVLID